MKLKGLTSEQLRTCVKRANLKHNSDICFNRMPERSGNFVVFTLRVESSKGKFARMGQHGRRMTSLCFHGHKAVMDEIFEINPEAVLASAQARYNGKEDFEYQWEAVGMRNIGSRMEPLYYEDACNCGGEG